MTIKEFRETLGRSTLLVAALSFGLLSSMGSIKTGENNDDDDDDPPDSATATLVADTSAVTATQGDVITFETTLNLESNVDVDHAFSGSLPDNLRDFASITYFDESTPPYRTVWEVLVDFDAPVGNYRIRTAVDVTSADSSASLASDVADVTLTVLPSDIAVSAPSAIDVYAGTHFSLALLSDGSVWSWGADRSGQLGNGGGRVGGDDGIDAYVPGQVTGLSGVQAIAAGGGGVDFAGLSGHALALMGDGTVMAWGRNGEGQLGDGTTDDAHQPVAVQGLSGVVDLAAGVRHSLAVLGDGRVVAWGNNRFGQLGNGTTDDSATPGFVSGLTGIAAVTASASTSYALGADGTVWAWGSNVDGSLGNGDCCTDANGDFLFEATPIAIPGLSGVAQIVGSDRGAAAVLNDGTVLTWGLSPISNATALDPPAVRPTIVDPDQLSDNRGSHILLVRNGAVEAWGVNRKGQIGDGTIDTRVDPVPVPGLQDITAIAAGAGHSLALQTTGSCGVIWAWGENQNGQLGDGAQTIGRFSRVSFTTSDTNDGFREFPNLVYGIGEQSCSAIAVTVLGDGTVSADVAAMNCDGPLCVGFFSPDQTVNLSTGDGQSATWGGACADPATGEDQNATTIQIQAAGHRNCTITFEPPVVENQPPTAAFTFTPALPEVNQTVTFDGSTASDPDGTIVSYEWDFTDDGTFDTTGVTADTTYTAAGTYPVRLRVTDDAGATAESTDAVTVVTPGSFFNLAIVFQGAGQGTVDVAPIGQTLPATGICDGNLCLLQNLSGGQTYTLTPSAANPNFFNGWVPGECDAEDVNTRTCSIVLNTDRQVTARFETE